MTGQAEPTKREIVTQLLGSGVAPEVIATALNIKPETVQAISTFRHTRLNSADAELAEAVRGLVASAIREASITIEYGPPAERISLIKAITGRATALIGVESTSRFDEVRSEFERLVGDMKPAAVPELPTDDADDIDTPTDFDNVFNAEELGSDAFDTYSPR